VVVDKIAFDDPKTKRTVEMLKAFEAEGAKALLILTRPAEGEEQKNDNVILSARNLEKVSVIDNGSLNCFDLLYSNKVFLDRSAVEKIEEVLA